MRTQPMRKQPMPRRIFSLVAAAGGLLLGPWAFAQDRGSVNVLCSVELEWCQLMSTSFEKETGIKVNMVRKSSGEVLAQLIAERANPKTDVWFGGTGDPHLQAAEQDLTLPYAAADAPKLQDWARLPLRGSAAWVCTLARWALRTTPKCWPAKSCRCRSVGKI
jgi:ABC-type thiamine transport system substrate-binding protein